MAFRIRMATPQDAPLLVELIRELAVYERLEHEVEADHNHLALHLGPDANPRVEAIIADSDDGRSAGFALFYSDYSTFLAGWGIYLEDLFVREEYRGVGIGMALLSRVASLAAERGAKRLNWQVLDWNESAIDFYQRIGARPLDDWRGMRLEGADLRAVAGSWPAARNRIAGYSGTI